MICRKCKQTVPDAPYCCQCGTQQEIQRKPKRRGNGQGTAYKRGKTYTASWVEAYYLDEQGKKHAKRHSKGGFKSLTAALAYAANPPELADKNQPETVRKYYNTYKNGHCSKLSSSKQTSYEIAWKRWEDLAEIDIRDLRITTLQNQLDDKVDTYYPARDMRTVMSGIYKLAMADGIVTVKLSDFLELPKLEEGEVEPFTDAEIKKFWEAYEGGNQFSAYILIMIYTGMMPGELMICRKEMIDYDKRQIVGDGIKTGIRKKTPMVFPDYLVPVLEDVSARSKRGKLLEMNRDNFYATWHATLRELGVRPLKPYSCRHTTATALILSGAALPIIKNIMRHSKITTTERYIHPDVADARAAINAMPKEQKSRPESPDG